MSDYKENYLFKKKDIAELYGKSVQAVNEWKVKPVMKRGRTVLYYLPEVIAYKSRADQENQNRTMGDLTEERTRKEKEQADKLEMENELTRKNQVLVSHVEDAIIEFVTLSKNKLMGIKKRIMRVIVARSNISISAKDQKKIEQGVDEEIRKALAELSGLNTENIKSRG